MPEIKTGGPGPEEQKPESELPPDLEQEKREIEARIEQQMQALQKIAEVFHIETDRFSDETDSNLIAKYKKGKAWIESYPESIHPKIRFIMSGGSSVRNLLMGQNESYDIEYPSVLLKDIGCLVIPTGGTSVNDLTGEMHRESSLLLSREEEEAFEYFQTITPSKTVVEDQTRSIEGEIKIAGIKQKALEDKQLAEFLIWADKNGELINHPMTLMGAIYRYCNESGINRDELIKKMDQNFEDPKFEELKKFRSRILAQLSNIYLTRVGYLTNLAIEGSDQRIKKDETEKEEGIEIYRVDQGFQFTEEDARKAKELNLPWSKLEKEIGESGE